MLIDIKFDHYIIALDGDARKETLKLADKLVRNNCKVSLIEFAYDEDPASITDFNDRLRNAKEFTFTNRIHFMMNDCAPC